MAKRPMNIFTPPALVKPSPTKPYITNVQIRDEIGNPWTVPVSTKSVKRPTKINDQTVIPVTIDLARNYKVFRRTPQHTWESKQISGELTARLLLDTTKKYMQAQRQQEKQPIKTDILTMPQNTISYER